MNDYFYLYNLIIYGQINSLSSLDYNEQIKIAEKSFLNKISYIGILAVLLILIQIFFYLYLFIKKKINSSNKNILLFIFINIFYVTLVVNSIEIIENNRMRFYIEPLLFILFGYFISYLYMNIKKYISK